MKNPLIKRLPRELVRDIGKYLVIFLFLTATIGFVSGFLVADGSMQRAYDESFATYNIEDGHFTLSAQADSTLLSKLAEQDVAVYPNFYVEQETAAGHTIRISANRTRVNLPSVLDGALPQSAGEIALDRLYAQNNRIDVGDTLELDGRRFRVSGLAALSDYSALFKNNTDMMFDAQKFSVALVTQGGFDSFGAGGLHYNYAWTDNDKTLSDRAKNDKADALMRLLAAKAPLTDFVKQADNQAIRFTGDDMGSDKAMITWMLYIVMAVLAFVFAVTAGHTVEQEAAVIGTLRASGYTRGELLRHYLTMPVLVSLAAALAGNVLGYTVFKWAVVGMYYGSYSLPAYQTVWNAEAFLLTTVAPCAIMLAVSLCVLARKLALPPLQFLRRELRKTAKSRAVRLPAFRFMARFHLRVILQNRAVYFMMFVGIALANILLFFGMLMSPLLAHYKADVVAGRIADYQYILKAPVETQDKNAEKYAALSLETGDTHEAITVYGIADDSRYLPSLHLPAGENEVALSDGYLQKYGLAVGDSVRLREKYSGKAYTFRIAGSYHYPASLAVFMKAAHFDTVFDKSAGYFTGYFSDEKLSDIAPAAVASTITQHDLTVIADQLDDSMGSILPMYGAFAVLLYILLVYLLSRLVLEKNAASISMVKILGYTNREAGRLYTLPTAVVVAVSLLASLPISYFFIRGIYYVMMQSFNGWLTFYVNPQTFVWMLAAGAASYALLSALQLRRIRKLPMNEALKGME